MDSAYKLKINKNHKSKAQALVEFALVLPVLLFVIMLVFEFGWLLKNYLGTNYALGQAAKTASLSRGVINADLKVIKVFLQNCYIINSSKVVFVSRTNKEYGPYILLNGNVCDIKGNKVTSITEELFFYNDKTTPMKLSDDVASDPSNKDFSGYAEITVVYKHNFATPIICGLGIEKTELNLKLKTVVKVIPGES